MSGCRGWSPLNLALQIAPWGSGHHQAFDERINHEVSLYMCGEDLPEETNRVELDWAHLDGFGMPGVRTQHELSENSRRLGRDMIAHAREVLDAAGAKSVRDFGLAPIWGWHLLGTARMGDDPATSVADRFNRAHDGAQPLHRRREQHADERRREPERDHSGARATVRGSHLGAPARLGERWMR